MKSGHPCRINGVTLAELSIRFGAGVEFALKTTSAFIGATGDTHGKTEFIGPWSAEVQQSVTKLREAIENDLLRVHFTVPGEEGAQPTSSNAGPKGILGTGFKSDLEPPQL